MEEDELDMLAALYTNHFLDYDIYQLCAYLSKLAPILTQDSCTTLTPLKLIHVASFYRLVSKTCWLCDRTEDLLLSQNSE